jgi:hypothetical protein
MFLQGLRDWNLPYSSRNREQKNDQNVMRNILAMFIMDNLSVFPDQ